MLLEDVLGDLRRDAAPRQVPLSGVIICPVHREEGQQLRVNSITASMYLHYKARRDAVSNAGKAP
jgi:hypothetical protein